MDKLRIGVYLDDKYDPTRGGSFSYSNGLIQQIDSFSFDNNLEIVFVSKNETPKNLFNKPVLEIPFRKLESQQWTLKRKVLHRLFSLGWLRGLKIHLQISNEVQRKVHLLVSDFLAENKIDIIYYLTPQINPFNFCYILTHWDIGIKSKFNFQKTFSVARYEEIDHYNRIGLQQAFAIFAESETSKNDLIRIEKIYGKKIFVVPLMPGNVINVEINEKDQANILMKWGLKKGEFYFYPAQFWGHKNHFSLVKAFKKISIKHPNLKLVLSGSDKGNMEYIKSVVEEENINKKVIFTGFISNEEMYSFYRNAIALVMPTLLGPTNMPLLEAYYLGCTVLCSNLEGHIEQMQNNATYFNPFDHDDIAQKMEEAISAEQKNIVAYTSDTASIINKHFQSLYNIRKTFP